MGGFAALHLALRHPALFSKVGGHSAALWDYSGNDQFLGQRDFLRAEDETMYRKLLAKGASVEFHSSGGARCGVLGEPAGDLSALLCECA